VNDISIELPIVLGAFLKVCGAAATGGHGKLLIQEGEVAVNGTVETRRGRKLTSGDVVRVGDEEYRVCSSIS
jgi:ribosome-associated protein